MEENTKKTCNGCGSFNEEQETESFAMQLLRGYAKHNKRWFITCMVILSMWLATIAGFVWYLYQYDFVSYDVSQDGQWGNTFIDGGNQGDINYGAESESAETETKE